MYTKKLLPILFFILAFFQLYSQTDKVHSLTGDILVGDLKSMKSGVLVFDTDYSDSDFQIDWDEIDGLEIGNSHIIYLSDGTRYRGGLIPLLGQRRLTRVITSTGEITMSLDEIVEIASLEQKFIERLNISIDAGLSITKANHVRQTSGSGNVSYRGDKWQVAANFSNVGTTQDDVDPIDRTEGGFTLTRDLFSNAFAMGGADFLSNSEQMLDLRSTGRGGLGAYFLRNNKLYFLIGAGLAFSNEQYGGDDAMGQNSFEGLGLTEFNVYNMGDLSFMAKVLSYPSFSNWGRWRINADVSLKYDLPLDFYLKLSYIHNFDSDPLIEVSNNDYVFKTSIGWEWD